MVHALQEIWRVLLPNGHLIDLRPRATNWPLEVVADGQVLFAGNVDNAPFVPDDRAAEQAIQRTVRGGLYSLEQKALFDCATYWDTLDDMVNHYIDGDTLIIPDPVLARARQLTSIPRQDKKVRLRLSMGLSRYRKLTHDNRS
jgi:hypothetical protein